MNSARIAPMRLTSLLFGVALALPLVFIQAPLGHAAALADNDGGLPLQLSADLTLRSSPPAAGPYRIATDKPAGDTTPPNAEPREIRDDLPPLPTIDLVTQPDDLWQRVRNGFRMPDLHNALVADRQAYYLNRPDMLRRILDRSRRYLYHIVTQLEKRGMPTELALLPMIESAFNPMAYSRARALGMWQFIPSTGKNYRLQQNDWLDQRRDIIASTSAALDYLQAIYEMNGDWQLALASYNWGENAVARAVARAKAKGEPTDYEHLSMPGETRYYVPKLQALKNIIADPALFGIHLDPIPNRPYFGTVDIDEDMDVSTAAKLAEIPLDEFVALNPAYHRPVILGKEPSPLVLPTEKLDTFRANLERYEAEDKPLSSWSTYRLKSGEKLEAVASRYDITLAKLKRLNGITPRMKIGPGFALLVPRPGTQANSDQLAAVLPTAPSDSPRGARSKGKGKGKHGSAKGNKSRAGSQKSAAGKTGNAKRPAAAKGKPAKKTKR